MAITTTISAVIVEQSGPLNEAGTRYVVDTRFGPFEVHVLRIEPPRLIEMIEGVGRRSEAHVTIRFDPADGGRTCLTSQQALSTRGRLGWLSGRLMTPFAWLYGQIELRRLRRVAERDARSHAVD